MKKAHDKHAQSPIKFSVRQEVLLEGTHIWTDRAIKKFDDKWYGPFKITRKVNQSTYELALPPTWKGIHPIFNESLLTSYHQGTFPSQEKPKPPPPIINEQEEEHEIEKIIDSWKHHGKLEYLIHWRSYPCEEREWKKMSELKNAQDAIKDFHHKNPNAPRLAIKIKFRSLFDDPNFLEYRKHFNRLPNELFEIPTSAEPCLIGILVDREFNS